MPIDFGLDDKRVLVTGAGQGVGQGIATMFAEAGAEVVVNDFVLARAEETAAEIVASGGRALPVQFDVSDLDAVRRSVEAVGPIDVLVNNAGNAGSEGFGSLAPFQTTTPEDWHKYFAVNLYGVMNCVHATLPGMIEAKWGRIVTIVSDAARLGESQMAAYCAAKAGAAGFSRGIALEVGRHGITVNCIALGTMRTPVSEAFWDDPAFADRQKAMMSRYVVRRPGDPADPAWIALTLASPRSNWVTGQTIPVNGGFSFAM